MSECVRPPGCAHNGDEDFQPHPFGSVVSAESGRLVLELQGDVDVAAGNWLIRPLNKAITSGRTELLIDTAGVTFWSVAAMDLLVTAAPAARAHGVRLVVLADDPRVRRPARLAGLDRWVEVHARHKSPLEAVTGAG